MAEPEQIWSLEAAFRLTLLEEEGAGGRQVLVRKLRVNHAPTVKGLLRRFNVSNHHGLINLSRADSILRLLQQAILLALLEDPASAPVVRALAASRQDLSNCTAAVGGSFLAVSNKLQRHMKRVGGACGPEHQSTVGDLRESVNDLNNTVTAVRESDVMLGYTKPTNMTG